MIGGWDVVGLAWLCCGVLCILTPIFTAQGLWSGKTVAWIWLSFVLLTILWIVGMERGWLYVPSQEVLDKIRTR